MNNTIRFKDLRKGERFEFVGGPYSRLAGPWKKIGTLAYENAQDPFFWYGIGSINIEVERKTE